MKKYIRIVGLLYLFLICFATANAQTESIIDTFLQTEGNYFYINDVRIYGQYKWDRITISDDRDIRCFSTATTFENKILIGKCLFYYPLKSKNSNGEIQFNDTTKVRMIIYFDNNGTPIKSIYLNNDGSIQYMYVKKEEN